MKKLILMLLGALALSAPAAASAEAFGPPDKPIDEVALAEKKKQERYERNQKIVLPGLIAAEVVQILDVVTTVQCGRAAHCEEVGAPGVYGRKPKLPRVLMVKAPIMLGTWLIGREVGKRSPAAAYTFFAASGIITGKAVAGNIRILW